MTQARKTDPHKAVAYLRVSTEEQDLGPEVQRADILAWSKRERIELVGEYLDKKSGALGLDKRPGLAEALEALRSHRAGLLVVQKRDRLSRDPDFCGHVSQIVARAGATIHAVDGMGNGEGAAAQFMRRVMDGAAEFERSLIKARTSAALRAKLARGEAAGGTAPYGYRLERGPGDEDQLLLVPDESEQHALAFARDLRAQGLSLRKIVDRLNASNHRPRGKVWHLARVRTFVDTPPGVST